jgi:hypothetical protein
VRERERESVRERERERERARERERERARERESMCKTECAKRASKSKRVLRVRAERERTS